MINAPRNIVAIAAHPDDIEFGCFGTLSKFKQEGAVIDVIITTSGGYKVHQDRGSAMPTRSWDIISGELESSMKIIDAKYVVLNNEILNLNVDGYTINAVEDILKQKEYDLVITHATDDYHQDHRATYQIVRAAARHNIKALWQMEIPIYSNRSNNFSPNVFVDVEAHMEKKISALSCYKTYVTDRMLSQVKSLAATRSAVFDKTNFAEAFVQEFILV